MSNRLIDLLLGLAPRERLLLGVLVFAVLPLAVLLGILLPLQERHAAARQTRAEAVALQGWVAARVAEKTRLGGTARAAAAAPIGSSGIEQSLIEARLRPAVSELGARAGGVIELRFDAVDFVRLATWLSAANAGMGYEISGFRFEAIDIPGKVTASLTLQPAG